LRIHKRRERFHISRGISMKVRTRTNNGRYHSNPHSTATISPFLRLLVGEASPPF